ncbi:MAG: PHP domain-containing protein [Chlamydiia bacterium]|nr:PHP domain-containing protein [Chlamydiia bacterium]
MTFRADLHCHSYYSDGEDSPYDLLAKAKASGLSGLSITDHDTIEAYVPGIFDEAKRQSIQLLPGIEVSSEWQGLSVHILGYGFDLKSASLSAFLHEMRQRRRKRNLAILEKLKTRNMPISEEELLGFVQQKSPHPQAAHRTIGRPHIAQLLVHKRHVKTTQEAFELYLKEGASCYAFGVKFTPREAIEQIHAASGKAILAHPHFLKGGSFLREIVALGFDGVECHYGTLAKELQKPWLELAEKRGWIATGGSDYHGSFKPLTPLGCSWVSEAVFERLAKK